MIASVWVLVRGNGDALFNRDLEGPVLKTV